MSETIRKIVSSIRGLFSSDESDPMKGMVNMEPEERKATEGPPLQEAIGHEADREIEA